mgnify:CR=1 FL=1|jgi:hypothetical protein
MTQFINDGGKNLSVQLQSDADYEVEADRNCNVEMRLYLKETDSGLQVRGVCFVVTGLIDASGAFTWRVRKGDMALTRYGPDYDWNEEDDLSYLIGPPEEARTQARTAWRERHGERRVACNP